MAKFYADRLEQHGPTPQGVGWADDCEVKMPYEVMARLLSPAQKDVVLDVGCGVGLGARYFDCLYIGCDVHKEALEHCTFPTVHGSIDVFQDNIVDYIVMHGIFNVGYSRLEKAGAVVGLALRVARKGIAFTVEPGLSYAFSRFSLWPDEEWASAANQWMVDPGFVSVGNNLVIWEKW